MVIKLGLLLVVCLSITDALDIDIHLDSDTDSLSSLNGLKFHLHKDGDPSHHMLMDVDLGSNIQKVSHSDGIEFAGSRNTVKFDLVKATVQHKIIRISRRLPRGSSTMDCVNLKAGEVHWYGGPQQKYQYWPVEKLNLKSYSYLTKEADNCGVAERYWVNTNGMFFYVDDTVPLFIDQNNERPGYICFKAQLTLPYDTHAEYFTLTYNIGFAEDAKAAHMLAIDHYLGKPISYPDERMVQHPIWSTWAKYKRPINESTVLNFAQQILDNNFENSQFEIDDDWEICYGAMEFNTNKFPDIKALTVKLNSMGFRTTLWIHPFINKVCEPYHTNAKNNK